MKICQKCNAGMLIHKKNNIYELTCFDFKIRLSKAVAFLNKNDINKYKNFFADDGFLSINKDNDKFESKVNKQCPYYIEHQLDEWNDKK